MSANGANEVILKTLFISHLFQLEIFKSLIKKLYLNTITADSFACSMKRFYFISYFFNLLMERNFKFLFKLFMSIYNITLYLIDCTILFRSIDV